MEKTENKYQRGKIYKLVSDQTTDVYSGSTIEPYLTIRLSRHRTSYKIWLNGKGNYVTSFEIVKYEDCDIILVEKFPCDSKDELRARETFYIDNNECVNKFKAHRTKEQIQEQKKEYYVQNKDKILELQKIHYEQNKDKIKECHRKYYDQNKDKIQERHKEYREYHRDEIKEHYDQNKDKIKEQKRQYREKNKNKIKEHYELNKDKIRDHRKEHYIQNKEK